MLGNVSSTLFLCVLLLLFPIDVYSVFVSRCHIRVYGGYGRLDGWLNWLAYMQQLYPCQSIVFDSATVRILPKHSKPTHCMCVFSCDQHAAHCFTVSVPTLISNSIDVSLLEIEENKKEKEKWKRKNERKKETNTKNNRYEGNKLLLLRYI